ncbi:hypothetical protein ACFCZ1_09160 [Streptomyces sp. NPDC056224]|uniref:hypothetical protein n=1 Tax=Streptomyces sp. NPDC056224 TaxID=3345750 RepID=UPI0035DA8B80
MIQGFRPPRRLARAALTAAAALAVAGPVCAVPALAAPVLAVPLLATQPLTLSALRLPALAAPALPVPALPRPALAAPAPAAPAPLRDDVPEEVREGLAGSSYGSGRERPGRPAGEPANPEMLVASRPDPAALPVRPLRPERPALPDPPRVAPTPPEVTVRAIGTEPNDRAADLAAHILPLGTGFALMGLGLGYLGVRLRRGL